MSTRSNLALTAALLLGAAALLRPSFGGISQGTTVDLSGYAKTSDLSAYAKTSDMPTPYASVPPGPNGLGTAQPSDKTYVPGNAMQRQGVMRTTLLTDSGGNWTVTWANSFAFLSSTPTVVVEAGNPSGSQPIACNWQTRSATGAAGKCWQANTSVLSVTAAVLALSGLSATVNAFTNPPAANTPISVIMAEPTQ
jgi:hypothetical protein